MALADKLAEFVVDTKFSDIPSETVEFTKHLASKIVAAMLYGATTRAGRGTSDYIRLKQGALQAGVIGARLRCSTSDAVFANGMTSHAAELEDDQFSCSVSDINIFPVIFPLAESEGLSGKDVIEASAIGLEVMNRIGMKSISPQGMTDLPFFGVIGSAVTAAKALNLSPEQVKWAIGIAVGRASGYIVNFGTDSHYVESAGACSDGLLAAELAKRDLTGTTDLEKWLREDVWQEGDLDLTPITAGLGDAPWRAHDTWVKKFPCCFLTHRHVDMMREVMAETRSTNDDISTIEVHTGPVDNICDRPAPTDTEDARFSFQHIIGCLILDGEIDSHHFTPPKVNNTAIAEAREKVSVTTHSDWPNEFMSGVAKIQVTFKSGAAMMKTRAKALGSPDQPLRKEQFKELFFKYTKPVLSRNNAAAVWEALDHLDELDQLDELMEQIVFPA